MDIQQDGEGDAGPERIKTTQSNGSVEKLIRVLELLARQTKPLRLRDFAEIAEMNSSTALRYLTTLQRSGYVAQEKDSGCYYMTMKICALAGLVSSHSEVKQICAPYLRSLSQIFTESVNLSIEQDMQLLYIDVINGKAQMLTTVQRIGNTAPLHCTGSGKLFMLDYDDAQLDQYIAVKGLVALTEKSITKREVLAEELERIGSVGYAWDNEECSLGARCIAAPIRGYTGKVVASVSVSGPISRMQDSFIYERLPFLLDAAREASYRMGYSPLGV
jgi:DNA-binding IclR family transcriptional regulator